MKTSFADKDEHHHHLDDVKIRLKAIAKIFADTKAGDKMSTFKMVGN